MFKLNKIHGIIRRTLKCVSIRCSPSQLSTINTASAQIHINLPREDSVISLLKIYLDSNFDVVQGATNNRYVDGSDIRLVNIGPVSFFSNYMLTLWSGKQIEDISHAHIVS